MKKQTFLLIAVFMVVLLAVGCTPAGSGETTLPPETTTPVETTLPAQTTVPPETTLPPENTLPPETEPARTRVEITDFFENYDQYLQAGFVHFHGIPYRNAAGEIEWDGQSLYRYEGESDTIRIPNSSIVITLPEGWSDRVFVTSSGMIYNRQVWDAQTDFDLSKNPSETPETVMAPYYDYMLKIRKIPHSFFEENKDHELHPTPYEPYEGIFIGEDENYVYWAIIAGDEYYDNERYHCQQFLMEHIGEEAYNKMMDGLELNYDMVREMVTIQPDTE